MKALSPSPRIPGSLVQRALGRVLPAIVLAGLLLPLGAAADEHFRAVTFNIYLGKGLEENPARFGRYLTESRPLADFDVIGMQEVCGDRDGRHMGMLKAILATRGPVYEHFVSSDPNDRKQCAKGQAIFSRHPILGRGSRLLPFVREPRMMVWVDLEVNGRAVRVYNLHLDSRSRNPLRSERDRRRQVLGALEHMRAYRAAHPDAAVVVTGDFNSWGRILTPGVRESGIREMEKHFDSTLRGFHITHYMPAQLDWIFYDGMELVRSAVIRRFMYSDHLPVYADFRL